MNEQSPTVDIDNLSICSFYVMMFRDTISLGSGTAFIYTRDNDETYLITNWHIVSGWSPITNQPLDKQNSTLPNLLKVRFYQEQDLTLPHWIDVKLLAPDGTPGWMVHPKYARQVDVAAIKVEIPNTVVATAINSLPCTQGFTAEVGQLRSCTNQDKPVIGE
jgi:hypothetical protein